MYHKWANKDLWQDSYESMFFSLCRISAPRNGERNVGFLEVKSGAAQTIPLAFLSSIRIDKILLCRVLETFSCLGTSIRVLRNAGEVGLVVVMVMNERGLVW